MTRRFGLSLALAAVALAPIAALEHPAFAGPMLAALAPSTTDDARLAVALGPEGQVYAPDGADAWVRREAITTADTLASAGRAGRDVIALGEGVVYRLATNGWSAIRLVQKGKAVVSPGLRSVAAVGRQLFALDRTTGGEPAKLALAPAPVLKIGAGARGLVIATAGGLLRLDGSKFTRLARAPRQVKQLINDRWALADRGAVDLQSNQATAWPTGLAVEIAAAGPDDALIAVGATRAGLELITLAKGRLTREPITGTAGGTAGGTARPVGVVVDRSGRATVALSDGRLAVRRGAGDRRTWTLVTVQEALPGPRPGAPPASSP